MPTTPEVPEGQLLEIVQTVYQSLPTTNIDAVQRQRRFVATRWLRQLVKTVHEWNLEFISLLKKYPGFKNSKDPGEYARFFDELLLYRHQLKTRGGGIKERLCSQLIQLNARLDEDFSWLAQSDNQAYGVLRDSCNEAYQDEVGVIGLALNLISKVVNPLDPPPSFVDLGQIVHTSNFLNDQIAQSDAVRLIIEQYTSESQAIVDRISDYRAAVDKKLLSVEEFERLESKLNEPGGLLEQETRVVQTSNRPEIVNARLYTILAFSFGVTFLAVLLWLTVMIPNPSNPQLRFWIAILALAAGGVSTVISGLINVRLSLGKQFGVGATGAFAVFVIVYFQNPAIFQN